MEKTGIVIEIESLLGVTLYPAPSYGADPVSRVMPFKNGHPHRYAMKKGHLVGLNLAGAKLTDEKWKAVLQKIGPGAARIEALNLRDNQLKASPVEGMTGLRYLDLSDNQLNEVDIALPSVAGDEVHLFLYGNDQLDPLLLATVQQGRHALRRYFEDLTAQGEEELYEARMLIIGEPRAGKTSLRNKLQDVANPLAVASTTGIDVDIDVKSNSFPYTTPAGRQVTFRYQVWDFGGQRQYHPTHQLFFSKSTLYLLVTNTDWNKNEEDVEFWLETVKKLGEGSPVLRVQNAPGNRPDETDWGALNRRFGDMIKDVFTINLNRVNPDDKAQYNIKDAKNFSLLKESIVAQLKALEHVGSKVPAIWKDIREALADEARKNACISLDRYQTICNNKKYTDPKRQLALSETFHRLGIFLHYQHNPALRHIVILQNEWAIDAVFAVLDSEIVKDNHGRFKESDLSAIWQQDKYEGKRDELLQLLQQFELCYPLPAKQGFVAPQRLGVSPPPEYRWDTNDNAQVDVCYDFLPRAIITRLIVKMHEHIAEQKQWVWQSGVALDGVALKCKLTSAYIEEKYRQKKIAIRLRGPYSEDLFKEIQSKLYEIHRDFPNLEVDYVIYCNCEDCRRSDNPTPFNYHKDLLRYRRELDLEEIECRTKGKKVKIADVLRGVISKEQANGDLKDTGLGGKIDRMMEEIGDLKNRQPIINIMQHHSTPEKSNSGIYGALTAFIVIVPTIAISVSQLTLWQAALTIVAAILLMMLVLVYAGTQSKTFSEDAFVKISEGILRKIPGLSSLVNLIKGL